MLDRRVYRAALWPAILVAFVAAFSLSDRPEPARSPLGGELFDVQRAYGTERSPSGSSLLELGQAFPARRAGSTGDHALAGRVATELGRAFGEEAVQRTTAEEPTPDGRLELATVTAVRPGATTRRIAIVAARDARGGPALAQLSGTAALIEIARVARTRDLRHSLELVSVSGGAAGTRRWARAASERGGMDAVLFLGDLASTQSRQPWVVPWSNTGRPASVALRRTVESALRREGAGEPGGTRASAQWVRRALPVTVGEQGEIVAAGLAAVKVSVSGERPPDADAEVDPERFEAVGRGVLRAISAIDARGGAEPFAPGGAGVVTVNRVLPAWAVRLLVAVLLLPAFLAAFDGYFRIRRRGLPTERWLAWVAAPAVAVLVGWAFARLLGALHAVDAPPGPAPEGLFPLEGGVIAALLATFAVTAAGFVLARRLGLRALGLRGRPRSTGGPAAAVGLVLTVTAFAVWLFNPFAAALLVPAVHAWLFAASPETRWGAAATVVALAAGLLLPVLAVVQLAGSLGMGPIDLAWLTFLSAAGGHMGPLGALAGGLVAAALWAAATAAKARLVVAIPQSGAGGDVVTRGPGTYAGPGSLGGTESALPR